MGRGQLKEWAGTAIVGTIFAAILFGLWHYAVVLPRKAQAQAAVEAAAFERLKTKVRDDFDDYLRAAPILKGDASKALESVINERIRGMGLAIYDPRISGKNPAQRWRSAEAIVAATEADRAVMENEIRRCSAVLDPAKCRDMLELWYCQWGSNCTENGAGLAEDIAWDWRE
jgi:hypothetical protein